VKGLPAEWSADFIRDEVLRLLEQADQYIMSAPTKLVGVLAVSRKSVPIEVSAAELGDAILRRATDEPEVMPAPADFNSVGWKHD
jgi:hypothetical protein